MPEIRFTRLRALFPSREEWGTHRITFALCALSGISGGFIFPKFAWGELAWVCLVPLFFALQSLRGRPLIWGTLIFGFIWHYLGLFWLNTLTVFNPFIPAGILLAAGIEAAYFLWFALPAAFVLRRFRPAVAIWLVAAFWVGAEYLRSFTDVAFPWNYLGHSQARSFASPLLGVASTFGVYGVSFLVAFSNAAIASALSSRRPLLIIWPAGLVALALACLLATTTIVSPPGTPLKVAIIQPNISQLDKWNSYAPETTEEQRMILESGMIRKQLALMQQAASQKPQLYVLPETAFTTPWFVYDKDLHKLLQDTARNLKADIFFGADNREPREQYLEQLRQGFREPRASAGSTSRTLPQLRVFVDDRGTTQLAEPGEMAIFNAAWQVKPDRGLVESVYNKVQLVPFGETAPLVDMIPFFQEKIMMVGSFQRGLEHTVFETSGVRYGALICFESAFSQLARGLVARSGARTIVVLTNDAWYDPAYLIKHGGFWGTLFRLPVIRTLAASGPGQHFVQSRFRAIETARPVLRAANTGISAVISSSGHVGQQLAFGKEGTIITNLITPSDAAGQTLYVRYGDWFASICMFSMFGVIVWRIAARWRRSELKPQMDTDQRR